MKRNTIASIVVPIVGLTVWGGAAHAACPTGISGDTIALRVTGLYACAIRGSDKWNELHQSTAPNAGLVLDYKMGPGDPVDPSATAANPTGTYTIAGGASPGTITYNYPPAGGTYTYVLVPQGFSTTQFAFCNVGTSEMINVTMKAVPVPCP